MSLFDTILVQPIFNFLLFIYGIIPGHDFGIAIILFTIAVRMAMWPLVRKQLHQTKAMQSLQPELKRIKKQTKGNKQLEAQLTMELYRERSVNPFSSIGLLIVQLPVFIALFAVVRRITENHGSNIATYAYDIVAKLPYVKEVIHNHDKFNPMLFGVIDLTKTAFGPHGIYWPLAILVVLAAITQLWQSKQLLPQVKEGRRLRDVLKDQASGKEIDQSEISALMSNRMVYMFPLLTIFISIYLAGALVLYLFVTSLVAVIQQRIILSDDAMEMSKLATTSKSKQKLEAAQEAEVVEEPEPKPKKSTKKKRKKTS